jgi:cardiolipin synthase
MEPFFPAWVKPNHITVLRFIMIPFVLGFLAMENYVVGIPLFFVAGFTDMVDGSLARVRRQITEWGIAYDPIADKLLVGLTLALLVLMQVGNTLLATVLLSIEGVLLLTNIAVRQFHIVRMATASGKVKMFLEVSGIVLMLFASAWKHSGLFTVSLYFLGGAIIAALLSVVSGIRYVAKDKPFSAKK